MSFWFDADSTMIVNHCGENTLDPLPHMLPFTIHKDNKLVTALNNINASWVHAENHSHWVLFDLGKPHYISSIRGLLTGTTNVKQVHFYIGDDPDNMGDSILQVIDWQDYTPTDSYRYEMSTPKLGRYVLLIIGKTTDPNNHLRWG